MPDLSELAIPYMSQPREGLLCAGQISVEQMNALRDAGYRSFISLRAANERGAGWEEAHANAEKIDFERLAIVGAEDIDEAHARELHQMLQDSEGPTVLYCGSSNRVGALLAIAAHRVDGKSAEEALRFGLASGVTGLEPLVREQLGLQAD